MRNYKSNSNVVWDCKYHIIWCPKYRRKVLVDDVARRLEEIIRGISKTNSVNIIELEIMPDHVHHLPKSIRNTARAAT